MVQQFLVPRMKDGGGTGLGLETGPGLGKLQEGSTGACKKHVVHELLVSEYERVELMREGQDDVEVSGGKQLPGTLEDPPNLWKVLALGAMTVPA